MQILLVDDDNDSRLSVKKFLQQLGHTVNSCAGGKEALQQLDQQDFSMVISDIKMPGMSGIHLLQAIRALPQGKNTDVVLFTGFGDIETAVAALRAGAYDYLLKPLNLEELVAVIEKIEEHQHLRRENRKNQAEINRLKKVLAQNAGLDQIGFHAECMQKNVAIALKYHTERQIPVLLEGETGTGKEVFARIIHFGAVEKMGQEEIGPFVAVNCAAISTSLFESELFGYEGGTFTGSNSKGKKGKFDLALGGTLFLDEVAEIPLELQGKLLRVLQEKQFYRVGGLQKIKTDVRIICATNAELKQKVVLGEFRQDLYYRLKVGHLVIPPLRERKEDILFLAELFLLEHSRKKGKNFSSISRESAQILKNYQWPGNVRELRNTMEWVVFMYDHSELLPEHLTMLQQENHQNRLSFNQDEAACLDLENFTLPPDQLLLEDFVNHIVSQALALHQGNKTETAKYLGISRRSLYCRLKHIKN